MTHDTNYRCREHPDVMVPGNRPWSCSQCRRDREQLRFEREKARRELAAKRQAKIEGVPDDIRVRRRESR